MPTGGRRKLFLLMAQSLFDLAQDGNVLTKKVKENTAMSMCEDRGIKVGKNHNSAKAYTVVDPFVDWVFDEDTDDQIALDLRPYLGSSGTAGAAEEEEDGGKTPAALIDLAAERARIEEMTRQREELLASNNTKQEERKAAHKALVQKEREVSARPLSTLPPASLTSYPSFPLAGPDHPGQED